jgi:SAM-dependent methyltransferase
MPPSPAIFDASADRQFRQRVQELFPESSEFEENYVDYEMTHIGQMFATDLCPVACKDVLEFGCNVGATSIVLAHYAAKVTAVDVNPEYVSLAGLNAQRYGAADKIEFHVLEPGKKLPFADTSFDVVTCNSVLEYVGHRMLPETQRELDRVLRPGGLLLVFGTSSRYWPREMHSGQWFINYLPTAFDPVIRPRHNRGVSPWRLRQGFGPHYDDVLSGWSGARKYVELKRSMGWSGLRLKLMHAVAPLFALSPLSLGSLFPYATVLLRKRAGG